MAYLKNWFIRYEQKIILYVNFAATYKFFIITFTRFKNVTYYNAVFMLFCSIKLTVLTSFGYKQEDGTMDGLVGELQMHRADFGLSPLFVHEDRVEVMTYGRHTYSLK